MSEAERLALGRLRVKLEASGIFLGLATEHWLQDPTTCS